MRVKELLAVPGDLHASLPCIKSVGEFSDLQIKAVPKEAEDALIAIRDRVPIPDGSYSLLQRIMCPRLRNQIFLLDQTRISRREALSALDNLRVHQPYFANDLFFNQTGQRDRQGPYTVPALENLFWQMERLFPQALADREAYSSTWTHRVREHRPVGPEDRVLAYTSLVSAIIDEQS
jgi:hypothetical protein